MGTVRQRKRTKNPNSRVSRRPRVVRQSVALEPTLKRHWDRNQPLEQNYRRLGLGNKINQDIGMPTTQRKIQDWNWKRAELVRKGKLEEAFDSEDEIFHELGEIFNAQEGPSTEAVKELEETARTRAAGLRKKEKPLSEFELEYIKRLAAKHGNDYGRMFMDIKLNSRQLTTHQLQKLAAKAGLQ